MSAPEPSVAESFGKLVGITVLGTALSILHGYAFHVLWGWFMVPQFALAPLSLGYAIGLATIWKLLQGIRRGPEPTLPEMVGQGVFLPLFALLFGWVTHLCVAP